jgi:hypothetical protein
MYSKKTSLIMGFHGCDKSVRDAKVYRHTLVAEESLLLTRKFIVLVDDQGLRKKNDCPYCKGYRRKERHFV